MIIILNDCHHLAAFVVIVHRLTQVRFVSLGLIHLESLPMSLSISLVDVSDDVERIKVKQINESRISSQ